MSQIHIIIHTLPREINDLERIITQLKRGSYILAPNEEVIIDVTLNLSDELTNWEKSKLKKEYFIERYEALKKITFDWAPNSIFEINDNSNRCLGINDKRRNSIRESSSQNYLYLDTDVHFSMYNLAYMFHALKNIPDEYYIISSQIVKLWDDSWDIIVNDRYLNEKSKKEKIWLNYDPYKIDVECMDNIGSGSINLKKLDTIKFGGGWFNLINGKLSKYIDIPDSLGYYGLDDTYVMHCSKILKEKGYEVNQYVLENIIVCENRKYREINPYKNLIVDKTISKKFKENNANKARQNYQKEIEKFIKTLK